MDGHFRQQSDHCNGIGYNNAIRSFTVEMLDPRTSRERVGAMLKRHSLKAGNFDTLYPPDNSAKVLPSTSFLVNSRTLTGVLIIRGPRSFPSRPHHTFIRCMLTHALY